MSMTSPDMIPLSYTTANGFSRVNIPGTLKLSNRICVAISASFFDHSTGTNSRMWRFQLSNV
jgi:hypothetical protein